MDQTFRRVMVSPLIDMGRVDGETVRDGRLGNHAGL